MPNYVFLSLRKQKEDIFTYGSVRNSNVIYCSKTGRFSLIKGRRSYGYEKKKNRIKESSATKKGRKAEYDQKT